MIIKTISNTGILISLWQAKPISSATYTLSLLISPASCYNQRLSICSMSQITIITYCLYFKNKATLRNVKFQPVARVELATSNLYPRITRRININQHFLPTLQLIYSEFLTFLQRSLCLFRYFYLTISEHSDYLKT